MYAKLNNGVPMYAPKNYKLDDGRIIVNFNKSEELMKEFGFKLIVDDKPEYDSQTQYIIITTYEEVGDNIKPIYEIKEIKNIEDEITVEQQISDLQQSDTDQQEALAELADMVTTLMEGDDK